jgi:hypothetical protein
MFRSALEALDEAICICDQTGNVLYANPVAERLTGCSGSEAGGKTCIQVLGSLATAILESAQGEKSKTYRGNIGLEGSDFEYSITSSQENDPASHFLITLKCPNAENDLRERDRIMAGATLATNQLLISGEMGLALNHSLEILGCSANVDRAYICVC